MRNAIVTQLELFLIGVCLAAVFPASAWPQTQLSGRLYGTVYDEGSPAKQGILGATVRLTSQDTLIARTLLTDKSGNYSFDLVAPGKYTVTAELQGYRNLDGNPEVEIELAKAIPMRVPPFRMQKVSGGQAPPPTLVTSNQNAGRLVDLTSATRGGVFTELHLQSLPLSGIRTFDALALLLPGVVGPPQTISSTPGPGIGASVGTAGQFSVNGLRSRGNNFTIDGSDNNDEDVGVRRQGFTSLVPQTIESVKQFQISTLLSEPQYGRNMGGQANAVSRSGGSGYHGTAYGFFTDSRFNARNFFDHSVGNVSSYPVTRSDQDSATVFLDRRPIVEPNPVGGENPFTRSQAGFVFGGPIRKERSFFFVALEHQDVNASRESHFAVPMVAQRGLFNSGATGLTRITVDPIDGERLFSGFFPASGFGDAVFSLYPWPNNPIGPYGHNTRTEVLPADADGTVISLKFDQQLNAFGRPHHVTGRYNFSNDDTVLPVTGEALFSTLRSKIKTQNFSLFLDTIFSPSKSNQARVSFGRTALNFEELPQGLGNQGVRGIGLVNPADRRFLVSAPIVYNFTAPRPAGGQPPTIFRSYADLAGATNLPSVNGTEAITGPIGQVILSGFSSLGVDVFNFPQQRVNNTFQLADTLQFNLNENHRFNIGLDVRRSHLNSFLDRNSRSQLVFNGAPNTNQVNGKPNEIFGPDQASDPRFTRTNPFYRGSDFAAVGAPTGFFQTLDGPEAFTTIGLRYWQMDLFASDQIRILPNLNLTLGLRYNLNTVPTESHGRIEDSFQSAEIRQYIASDPAVARFFGGRTSIFQSDHNNWGPYLGFAWDPFKNGKTAIRGGAGLYYDQIPGAIVSQSRNVFPNFLTLNLGGYQRSAVAADGNFVLEATNPASFALPGSLNTYDASKGGQDLNAFMSEVARRTRYATGPAFVLPAFDLPTPQASHWGITIERELPGEHLLSLAYIATQGIHLLRFASPNLGPNAIPVVREVRSTPRNALEPQFVGTSLAPGTVTRATPSGIETNGRPSSSLGSFTSIEADSRSSYHSLQVQLNRRLSRGLQMTHSYTWSHAIDEVSELFNVLGSPTLPQDSLNRSADRANSSFDARHRYVFSFVWDLPILRNHSWLGGWQASGIGTFQAGQPYSILAPYDVNLDGNLTDRINSVSGFSKVNQSETQFLLTDASTNLAPVGSSGAVGRNVFNAPGIANIDLALMKEFRLSETSTINFRAELFNLFNHTHFGIPVHQVEFPSFGRSTNTTVPSRVIQLSMRFSF